MIQVGLLTETQKDQLVGQLYNSDSYFNPIQDIDSNWVISTEEIEQNENIEFMWIKDLPLIEYKPIPTPPPFEK
jgi:hypothetical protein